MAINVSCLRALNMAARLYGVDFSRTVMLGRQANRFTDQELSDIICHPLSLSDGADLGRYSEGLFRLLGASDVQSIDASAYEGASIVADFNQPLPLSQHGLYTLYCDFGSMEHIFNVPQVLRNATDLVADNGHLLIVTTCRGFETHGLYQFSPEFFYSALSRRNGFERTTVFLVDLEADGQWLYVRNPAVTGRRTDCSGIGKSLVVAITQKTGNVPVLHVQQSFYEQGSWEKPPPIKLKRKKRRPYSRVVRQVFRNLRRTLHGERSDLIPVEVDKISHGDFRTLVSKAERAVASRTPAEPGRQQLEQRP
jgi:hypothetical protein